MTWYQTQIAVKYLCKHDISKSDFHCAGKVTSQNKLCMKMCQKGHKTQKKCVKISKIRFKEVMFTVLHSKARILRRLWKNLLRRDPVCLPILETLVEHPLRT